MFSLRYRGSLICVLLGCCLWVGASEVAGIGRVAPARSAAAVGDAFTIRPGARDAGDPLFGTTTEVGGRTWSGGPNLKGLQFAADAANPGGYVTFATDAATAEASVPFDVPAGRTVRVAADVRPRSADPVDWVAVGFGNPGGDPFERFTAPEPHVNLTFTGNPWALVRTNGEFYVFAGPGTANEMGHGMAGSYVPGAFNRMELDYDTAADTVTFRLNGVEQPLDDPVVHAPGPLAGAGFRMHRSQHGDIDNFSVAVVPEPVPQGLLARAGPARLLRQRMP